VKVVDETVSREALFSDEDGEEGASEPDQAAGGQESGKGE